VQASISSAEHCIHWYFVGPWLQELVSVTGEPSVGVALLAATVQVGPALAGGCQLSVIDAGALFPRLLVATTL
jgi:hypothetical protein